MRHSALPLLALLSLAGAGHGQTIERVRLTDNDLTCTQIYAEVQQMDTMIKLSASMPAPVQTPPGYPPPQAAAHGAQAAPLSAAQQAVLNHPNNAGLNAEQRAALLAQTAMAEQRGNSAVASLYANNAAQNYAFQGAVLSDPRVAASVARARAAGMSDAQIAATLGVGMQRAGLPQMPAGLPAAPSAGQAYAQAGGLAGMLNSGMAAQGGGGAAGVAGLFGAIAGMANAAQASPAPAAQAAAVPAPAPVMPVAAAPTAPTASHIGQQAQARKDHLTGMFLSKGCKLSDVQK